MSEETKEPLEETPVTAETAETEQEKTPENQEPEKKAKKKEKKEKGITFTREQVEKIESRGMHVEAFESYLMMHRCGMSPHGGLGLGLERFTARLLGFENVRNASLFPRDIHRLIP